MLDHPLFIALAVVATTIGALLAIASTRSGTYRVQRSIRIRASREIVFACIEDVERWREWLTADTAAHGKIVGPRVFEWEGDSKVGKGRLEITEIASPERVIVVATFERPFVARNTNTFTLEPASDGTTVVWTWDAAIPSYVLKLMTTVVGAERIFGRHFEAGLEKLEAAASASVTRAA
jgi:uncharacterized protein YndB with AHSA1/START domain